MQTKNPKMYIHMSYFITQTLPPEHVNKQRCKLNFHPCLSPYPDENAKEISMFTLLQHHFSNILKIMQNREKKQGKKLPPPLKLGAYFFQIKPKCEATKSSELDG